MLESPAGTTRETLNTSDIYFKNIFTNKYIIKSYINVSH